MKIDRRWLLIPVLVGAGLVASQAVSQSASPKALPAAPARAPEPPPGLAMADREALQKQLAAEGRVIHLSGPETKGAAIELAGRLVQFPPDAYVAKFVVGIDCRPGSPCPDELPFLIIARGGSQIWVGAQSGRVYFQAGEGFDFLREAVRP